MSDSTFIYYDGNDIGLKFEQVYIESNIPKLKELSGNILKIHNRITDFVSFYGGVVIESGGDEGLIEFSEPVCFEWVRGISMIWMSYGLTATVGYGNSIHDAHNMVIQRKRSRKILVDTANA